MVHLYLKALRLAILNRLNPFKLTEKKSPLHKKKMVFSLKKPTLKRKLLLKYDFK